VNDALNSEVFEEIEFIEENKKRIKNVEAIM
jgi:hypothetical protein